MTLQNSGTRYHGNNISNSYFNDKSNAEHEMMYTHHNLRNVIASLVDFLQCIYLIG